MNALRAIGLVAMLLAAPAGAQTVGPSPGTASVAGQIPGTATNDNAAAGKVGEYSEQSVPVGSEVVLVVSTSTNIASLSLTAGDWDVSGVVFTDAGGTAVISHVEIGISATSATLPTRGANGSSVLFNISATAGNNLGFATSPARFTTAATATVYLVVNVTWSPGTLSAYGFIRARRVR